MRAKGDYKMPFSFNPLWKLLIDKGMTKEKLRTSGMQ